MTILDGIRDLVRDSDHWLIDFRSGRVAMPYLDWNIPHLLLRVRSLLSNLPPRNLTSLAPLRECIHGLSFILQCILTIVDDYFELTPGDFCMHGRICAWIQYLCWYLGWFIELIRGEVISYRHCKNIFTFIGWLIILMRGRLYNLGGITNFCWAAGGNHVNFAPIFS